jgi:hypothetical protein
LSDEKRNLRSPLVRLIVLFVAVGVAQLAFAVLILIEDRSTYWFLTIMIVGMLMNMGVIVYTAGSILKKGREKADESTHTCSEAERLLPPSGAWSREARLRAASGGSPSRRLIRPTARALWVASELTTNWRKPPREAVPPHIAPRRR